MSVEPGPNEPEDPAVENFLPPEPQLGEYSADLPRRVTVRRNSNRGRTW